VLLEPTAKTWYKLALGHIFHIHTYLYFIYKTHKGSRTKAIGCHDVPFTTPIRVHFGQENKKQWGCPIQLQFQVICGRFVLPISGKMAHTHSTLWITRPDPLERRALQALTWLGHEPSAATCRHGWKSQKAWMNYRRLSINL